MNQRTRRRIARGGMAAGGLAVVVVLGAPLLALAGLLKWHRHVYQEISYQWIARTELPQGAVEARQLVGAAMDYTRRQLWLLDGIQPYDGKPFDYLVQGIGWCDYNAKVFCRLLAARGVHARYVFLKDSRYESPHTIAEVKIGEHWRAVDPFFRLDYQENTDSAAELYAITPKTVAALPEINSLQRINPTLREKILTIARRTLPPPVPPQYSDDFVLDRNLLDRVTDAYVALFGRRFVYWYQDRYLERSLPRIADPNERRWVQARHYHLYGRFAEAEPLYRALLADAANTRYRERTTLFLCRLLLREGRFAESQDLLQAFLARFPERPWPYFQLALSYETAGDRERAARWYLEYQRRGGQKYAVEAAQHLGRLRDVSVPL